MTAVSNRRLATLVEDPEQITPVEVQQLLTEVAKRRGPRSGAELVSRGINRARTPQLSASERRFADAKKVALGRDGYADVLTGERTNLQVHHRVPRGMGGRSRDVQAHRLSALITVSDDTHLRIESDRVWARRMGYLVPTGIDPETWPIFRHGAWSLLLDDGSTVPTTEPKD